MVEDKKSKRSRPDERWADYKAWASMASSLGIQLDEFCSGCGYAHQTWHHWKGTGRVPLTALLAGEALLRRQNQDVRNAPAFVKLSVVGGVVRIEPLAIEEVSILGTSYRVIRN